jgi:phosphoenolpyruvate carboxykinase (GTP)
MLVSPLAAQGYRVWTVGDDIAWMRVGADGRLWASNPENGFFGVVPGTSCHTNPNMMTAVQSETIFTNVALTPRNEPWWEGIDLPMPAGTVDWQGRPFVAAKGAYAAHPNSRCTVPTRRCPSISPHWEDPQGVPISAIIFGGRRARLAPLVYQSFDWQHGVYVGATMASETTAAATGRVGVVRRDPMAMLPFCGYHMGDYFGHWLEMGGRLSNPPKIFHVNWFRVGEDGRFLWPGFGQNVRVLKWILDRVESAADAREEAIGYLPTPSSLDLDGLGLSESALHQLLAIDRQAWQSEVSDHAAFLTQFGDRLPAEFTWQQQRLAKRLEHPARQSGQR